MKHKLLNKLLFLTLLTLGGVVINPAWADTYEYTFTSNAWTSNGSTTLNGVSWTLNMDGGSISSYVETSGMHFGTNSSTCSSVSISTSGIDGTITAVTVRASRGSSLVGNLSVKVGSTTFKCNNESSVGLTTTTTDYEFTGSESGTIDIKWTKSSGKGAFWIKYISVTYTSGFTVTYDANGATSGSVPTDENSYEADDEVTVLGNTGSLAKTGNAFSGWNTQADGLGTDRAAGSTFNITANTTLYAKWTPYTITAQSNNDSYGTVDLVGSTITATPEAGYRVSTSTPYTISPAESSTVVQDGNEFTVTPSANTTVTINFEAIPCYTVTLSDDAENPMTEYSPGVGCTLPSRDAIGSYTFAGWSETNVSDETTTAPTIIPAGTYYPTANITLYPVYTKTEGGGGSINETASVNIASYATAHSWSNGTLYETVTLDENVTATANGSSNTGKYYTSGNEWRFYQGEDAYLVIETTSGTLTSATITYNISNTGQLTYEDTVVNSGSEIDLSGTQACFWVENSGSATNGQVKITAIEVNYSVSSGTTYYWSAPVVVPVSSVSVDATASVNVGETTTLVATISPNNATNKNVTWTSSDETVATVDASGVVTGVAAGEATITVTSVADGTKTANCTVTVTTVAVTGVTVAPTSATVKIGKTVTLTPTISPANATNKNVTWESNNTSIATVDGGVVTGVAAGEATITVKSAADPTKSASCTITVITAGDGSKAKPYDVEEALEIISGYSSGSGSAENVYTKGIVSSVGSMYNSTMLTYFISIDGTGENTIQVFRGKNLGNTNFAAASDISVNDEVIVYGQLYKYNSTSEINTGNYIYSLNGVKIPEITFGAASYEVVYNGSLTITATADCSGAITYSSSDNTVAEINATTGVVTPHKAGEVTITANVAASVDNIAGSKDVTLTVTDGRTPAGIAFANASVTKTWGEAFTGQELTNPNSIDVTYESSEPTVATVNESGVVTVVKAGETTITASFAGDEDYMSAEVSYTLTVNKAAAGLSFTVTEYDFDLNDESFTGVAVNNPNSLTVTYESSDEAIALVDENDGTLVLDARAEGTVTITASFAGNDNYNAGNASYTITITDPDRKGTKKNPYTVAEVINGTASGTDIYVKGFIVGEYVGKTTNPRTSGFTTDGNIAIADEFTTSPTAGGSIPVQLGTDALKYAWGCKTSNGGTLRYEVLIKGDITTYFSVNGIKNTDEVSAVSVPAKFNASGYATFASTYPLDFSDDSEFSAWQITAANKTSGVLTFSQITGTVAAGTGVLLKGTASETVSIPVAASGSDISSTNLLEAVTTATDVTAGQYYGLKGDQFVPVNAGTVPAGKALLPVAAATGVKAFVFDFEDDATAIKDLNDLKDSKDSKDLNDVIYNLAGQMVNGKSVNGKLPKGIYIVNGKKIMY